MWKRPVAGNLLFRQRSVFPLPEIAEPPVFGPLAQRSTGAQQEQGSLFGGQDVAERLINSRDPVPGGGCSRCE